MFALLIIGIICAVSAWLCIIGGEEIKEDE